MDLAQFAAASLPEMERMPYHLGLATNDVDRAVQVLTDAFGFRWSDRSHAEPMDFWSPDGPVSLESVAVHTIGGPMHIELIQGAPGGVWATDELIALHHHAYWSNDVRGDVERLQRRGWRIQVCALGDDGKPAMFAYLTKPGQFRVELVDIARYPRYCERVGAQVPLTL